ncbi:MAG: hypothetical protein C0410_13260 [Anaerolinea sp.]|nr:hypothetical protein [Anaerolinea sp.]
MITQLAPFGALWMKQKQIINFLFIGIVVVLLSLAVIALLNKNEPLLSEDINTTPTIDIALSVTQTMNAINSATQSAKPTETPIKPTITSQSPTATPFLLPEEAYIRGFVGHRQAYSIGCETSVAVDLAAFYDVTITEYDFQTNLPLSDNPDLGFVGDVNGPWGQIPPYAYGVHAAPVVNLLTKFGVPVEGGKGYTLDEIKAQLAQSKPVIAWVIGHMEYSDPVEYADKEGVISIVAPYEHVVVLTGYNADTVRYNNEGRYADVKIETFLKSWGVLGNMAVFHQ